MKYLPLLFLVGCASVPDDLLPRTANALDGLKSFYRAACENAAPELEESCEDAREAINTVGGVYNELNELVGEE